MVIMGPVVTGAWAVLSDVVMAEILVSGAATSRQWDVRRQRMMAIFF
jgi:hypothetical protein